MSLCSLQVMAMEAESEAVAMLVAGDGLENKFAQVSALRASQGWTASDSMPLLSQQQGSWTSGYFYCWVVLSCWMNWVDR